MSETEMMDRRGREHAANSKTGQEKQRGKSVQCSGKKKGLQKKMGKWCVVVVVGVGAGATKCTGVLPCLHAKRLRGTTQQILSLSPVLFLSFFSFSSSFLHCHCHRPLPREREEKLQISHWEERSPAARRERERRELPPGRGKRCVWRVKQKCVCAAAEAVGGGRRGKG